MKSSKKEPVIYDYMPFTAEDVAAALQKPEVQAVCKDAQLVWQPASAFPPMWELKLWLPDGTEHSVLYLWPKQLRILGGFGIITASVYAKIDMFAFVLNKISTLQQGPLQKAALCLITQAQACAHERRAAAKKQAA